MKTKNTLLRSFGGLFFAAAAGFIGLGAFSGGSSGTPRAALRFEVPPYVMRCAYKVYKDPTVLNGRYWVAKTTLKNEGDAQLHDIEIACRIPGLTEWEFPKNFPAVLPGQTLTHCYYPDFDDSIVEKTTKDREVVEVRFRYREIADGEVTEELRQLPITMLGRNQLAYTDVEASEVVSLADHYTNTHFDACFVTPNDPIIRYFTQRIQRRMGGSISNSGNPVEIEKFVKATYDTIADCGVRYGGTTGLPMTSGGVQTTIQEVRLPREVITGTAGLCIELANLFASIFASEGLQPVLFFTNNHAWPGVRMPDGSYLAVESTMVGGSDFAGAKNMGELNTVAFLNGGQVPLKDGGVHSVVPMQLIDVASYHAQGIRPIELADAPDLRARIDTLFEEMERRPAAQEQSSQQGQQQQGQPEPPVVAGNSFQSMLGLNVQIPQGWATVQQPLSHIPALELSASIDPSGNGFGIEVYSFAGARTPQDAIGQLSRATSAYGMRFKYQDSGVVPNTNFNQISGSTYINGVCSLDWIAYLRPGNGGITGVVFHAPTGQLGNYAEQVAAISNSIQ